MNEIAAESATIGSDMAAKVTQNVTQSVLIKMQELSMEYTMLKAKQRRIDDKYEAKTTTCTTTVGVQDDPLYPNTTDEFFSDV